jgi:hypothetical protein
MTGISDWHARGGTPAESAAHPWRVVVSVAPPVIGRCRAGIGDPAAAMSTMDEPVPAEYAWVDEDGAEVRLTI